ncbi:MULTISPECIES: lipid-A-disaccharide synthase [unclassified Anabaena]|uniref:lipid-A-disaccharide synthase n=1 Tax=unclassified Anabaena TaxID=2619674 RepID=UPI001445A3A6|nr:MULTISPECIES: lipid-A-disaccharide synthase [unclassified Anabaena]MTJ09719.1 lipid-A-disaccharide synthase [Anabaena sp. UHCC 0204]MTJ54086.1 lipid-A-disaccharide synthase [Anabaena sp. UHCC 0253]
MNPVDIIILSNGPGEVTTWVRPVVKALRKQLGDDISQVRISVILSPCPHASGQETAIAQSYPEVNRVQAPEHFWQFLLWGKTAESWDWRSQGVVIFLGGDQLFPVIVGKKLGYKTIVYAEWEARWHGFIDKFAIMKAQVAKNVSPKYANKFTVVGDLMLDVGENVHGGSKLNTTKILGILPGSKAAKLTQGVPLMLAIAEYIHKKSPQIEFFIPVAPTLSLATLASFANPETNKFTKIFGFEGASLSGNLLTTTTGLSVELKQENPAYDSLSKCSLCLTTVGANTAELGALAIPMIILLPTQQLDAMRSWDGLPGLLANLPGVGSSLAKLINWWMIKHKGLYAWPNIWAQAEIVPELVGELQASEVGEMVLDFLENPQKLEVIRNDLRNVRGEGGAGEKLAILVKQELF